MTAAYCCYDRREQVEFRCEDHPDPYDCPDNLVIETGQGYFALINPRRRLVARGDPVLPLVWLSPPRAARVAHTCRSRAADRAARTRQHVRVQVTIVAGDRR